MAQFQGNKGIKSNFEGNRGIKKILGNREHRKQIFDFEQGNKPIYFRRTSEQVSPWEGFPVRTFGRAAIAA